MTVAVISPGPPEPPGRWTQEKSGVGAALIVGLRLTSVRQITSMLTRLCRGRLSVKLILTGIHIVPARSLPILCERLALSHSEGCGSCFFTSDLALIAHAILARETGTGGLLVVQSRKGRAHGVDRCAK